MKGNNLLLILAYIIMGVSGFLLGGYIGRRMPVISPIEPIKDKVDTLFIRDTITVQKPVYLTKTKLDSILVPADTVRLHDTLFVYLQREQVVWQDSLSMVYASGILPQVDSVRHFVEQRVVTIDHFREVTKKTHWGLGINAGYGASKDGLSPYIGIGVSYNILSW